MLSEGDGYLRIGATDAPPRHHGEAPDRLVFVDGDLYARDTPERIADQLRRAPRGYFSHGPIVLIRWPDELDPPGDAALVVVREQLQHFARRDEMFVGAVRFRVGQTPEVTWLPGPPSDGDDVQLARARAVELSALLEWGRAIWRPPGYHYQLPSGEHTDAFVRVADAIRSPRDAFVIASWLFRNAGPELSIILDTSTLVPVVLALSERLAREEARLGPVATLDEYPETYSEFTDLVSRVGGAGTLALVSVSSTGRTIESLARALDSRASSGDWRLEPLVRRTAEAAGSSEFGMAGPGVGSPWLTANLGASYTRATDECGFCNGRSKRPYVGIDPHTFSTVVLPDQPLVDTPHVQYDHADLLELYDRLDAIGLECAPPHRTELRRGKQPSFIRFYPHELLRSDEFLPLVEERLQGMAASSDGDAHDGWCSPSLLRDFDAIAYLDEDDKPGFDRLLEAIRSVLSPEGDHVHVRFSGNNAVRADDADVQAVEMLKPCRKVLVVTIGAVTGGTMQELLWRVHEAKRGSSKDSYQVSGLAIHARPETFREWESLRNAYGGGLAALWITYLPWRSVLNEEFRLLQQLPATGSFDIHRRRYCKPPTTDWFRRLAQFERYPQLSNPHALFWGVDPQASEAKRPRLHATSRFGHEVGSIAAFVGMGAAMQRARLKNRPKGAPPWLHFEMGALTTSYFDTLLLVSVLRWLEPYEGHWDAGARSVQEILNEIWHRVDVADESQQIILLPELLLAAAQAKLPRAAEPWLRARIEEVRHRWTGPALEATILGERLLNFAYQGVEWGR